MFQFILSRSKQTFIIDESSIFILSDKQHAESVTLSCISKHYAQNTLSLSVWIQQLSTFDSFMLSLRDAYAKDYNMQHVIESEILLLQWCKKLIFIDL